jgi:hypothetical protein
MEEKQIRCIAYYLPQFHPIPENNEWWGAGFTEWTNVTRAKKYFRGHNQPNLPADLGFYDLRLPETREAQAEMAKQYGIEGFCYWHYWMGNGKRILERPFNEVLDSGKPDFPFCVAWANHSWTGHWFGNFAKTLLQQEYPGKEDYLEHFKYLNKAFSDPRYIHVDGKPLFYIYHAFALPNPKEFTDYFRELALQHGHKGLYIITEYAGYDELKRYGVDGAVFPYHRQIGFKEISLKKKIFTLLKKDCLQVYEYKDAMKYFLKSKYAGNEFPCIVPNWDSSPRLGKKGVVFKNPTPELFRQHLQEVKQALQNHEPEHKIAFLKSWNEWAEGNYIEPDQQFGHAFLQVLKEEITK